MHIKDWKKEIWTIPNLLSLFRLVLIPVYVVIYLNARNNYDYYIAAGILAVSCLTDLIDGKIARHFNMISKVGKILDPVADKLTQFSLILCLSMKYPILVYLIVLFVIKESFQLIAGGISIIKKNKMLKGALLTGKICTTILFLSLILMVMLPDLPESVIFYIFVTDIAFMLVSFVDYLITYSKRDSKFQSLDEE